MGKIVSAMAPCPWTYFEIAEKLSRYNTENDTYRKWVQFYSSSDSFMQVEDLKNCMRICAQLRNLLELHPCSPEFARQPNGHVRRSRQDDCGSEDRYVISPSTRICR